MHSANEARAGKEDRALGAQMNEPQKKHWTEIGRIKNSDWYRRLPELERQTILMALEYDTHDSAVKLRAVLAVTFSTALCASGAAIWAVVFGAHILWFSIAGGTAGVAIGFVVANVMLVQKTPQDASATQRMIGVFIGLPELTFLALGLIALIIHAAT